jgi:hypothetical protein
LSVERHEQKLEVKKRNLHSSWQILYRYKRINSGASSKWQTVTINATCEFAIKGYNAFMIPTQPKTQENQQSTVNFLLEMADRIAKEAPISELEKLPTDGGENLDHYLYGAPKQYL